MSEAKKCPELEFPRDWQYRVIIEQSHPECLNKLACLVAEEEISPLNFRHVKASDTGKYLVFEIVRHATSREDMQKFGQKIAGIDGVKIVL